MPRLCHKLCRPKQTREKKKKKKQRSIVLQSFKALEIVEGGVAIQYKGSDSLAYFGIIRWTVAILPLAAATTIA